MTNKILLGHGSGGRLTRELIKDIFLDAISDKCDYQLDDGVILNICSEEIVFTTDSYVVNPIEFPGGSIGTLCVSGTVNDLSVMGAKPLYLSLGIILEEGFEIDQLKRIVKDISDTAKIAGVKIVCGDTKVVEKGKGDKIFINTSGIGILEKSLNPDSISVGDSIIVNGTLGDHAASLLSVRKGFPFKTKINSDCAPLYDLINSVFSQIPIKWMRDITRGGIATILNELVEEQKWGVMLCEENMPINETVNALMETLGLDPIYLACEGKVVMVVSKENEYETIEILKKHPLGENAKVIGEITEKYKEQVVLKTIMGTMRSVITLNSDPLPRIC